MINSKSREYEIYSSKEIYLLVSEGLSDFKKVNQLEKEIKEAKESNTSLFSYGWKVVTYLAFDSSDEEERIEDAEAHLNVQYNEFIKKLNSPSHFQTKEDEFNYLLDLCELSIEFQKAQASFITSKCHFIVTSILENQSEEIYNSNINKIDEFEKKFKSNIESRVDLINEKIKLINEKLIVIDLEIINKKEKMTEDFKNAYVHPMNTLLDRLQNQAESLYSTINKMYLNEDSHISDFKKKSNKLIKQCKKKAEKISKLLNTENLIEEFNEKQKQAEKLVIDIKQMRYTFESDCSERIIQTYNELKNLDGNDIKEIVKDLHRLMNEQAARLKIAGSLLPEMNSERIDFNDCAVFEENFLLENWFLKSWGVLLVDGNEGFRSTVNGLKQKLRESKKLGDNQQTTERKRTIYSCVLNRLLEVIQEKNRCLNDENKPLSEIQRSIRSLELAILNRKFEQLVEKYKNLEAPRESFMEAASNLALSVASFGIIGKKPSTYDQFLVQKKFADAGYSMMETLKSWLNAWTIDDRGIQQGLKKEVNEFLAWADSDPETAAILAKDMFLTCSILIDKPFADQFASAMRAKAYASALKTGKNPFKKNTSQINEKTKKYYALSQLFRYAPTTLAVGKSLLNANWANPLGVVVNCYKEAVIANLVQEMADFVPEAYAEIGLQAFNILRGESMQSLLEEQRNIELIKISGKVRHLFNDPKGTFENINTELKIWLRVMKQGTGKERVTRFFLDVVAPLSVTLAAVGVVVALGFTASAFSVGVSVLSIGGSTAWKIHLLMDKNSSGRSAAIASIKKEREESVKQQTKKEVENQAIKLIQELRQKNILPSQIENVDSVIIEDQLISDLDKLDKEHIVQEFTRFFKEKEERLSDSDKEKNQKAQNQLVDQWLLPQLTQVMLNKMIDFAHEKEQPIEKKVEELKVCLQSEFEGVLAKNKVDHSSLKAAFDRCMA